jgi:probable rRNA maturation factor
MRAATLLHLSIRASTGKRLVPYLRRHLQAAHAMLKPPLAELSLVLAGDALMSRLHGTYFNLPTPTDVLTFELEHDSRGRVTEGEVIVCVPQAGRQAQRTLEQEVLLCALHGMLHLCGFDDRTETGFSAMHRAEDRILSRLGVGRVFSPGRGTDQRCGVGP